MIHLHLDARRHLLLHRLFKLLFECVFIVAQSKLTPAQSFISGETDTNGAAYFAIGVDLEIRIPELAGRLVTGNRRREDYRTFIGLANSLGRRVLPMQLAILRIAFAGIEKLFLAIDLHDGDIVIQLTQVKIIGQEKITIAVGYDPHVRFESCSASKADEEPGELIPITPF